MEWAEVINNPILKDLPFKIELNKFGKILMNPASNQHGRIQSCVTEILINKSMSYHQVKLLLNVLCKHQKMLK